MVSPRSRRPSWLTSTSGPRPPKSSAIFNNIRTCLTSSSPSANFKTISSVISRPRAMSTTCTTGVSKSSPGSARTKRLQGMLNLQTGTRAPCFLQAPSPFSDDFFFLQLAFLFCLIGHSLWHILGDTRIWSPIFNRFERKHVLKPVLGDATNRFWLHPVDCSQSPVSCKLWRWHPCLSCTCGRSWPTDLVDYHPPQQLTPISTGGYAMFPNMHGRCLTIRG